MMKNNLDKQLEERRKKSDGDFEHRIAWCKNFWKLMSGIETLKSLLGSTFLFSISCNNLLVSSNVLETFSKELFFNCTIWFLLVSSAIHFTFDLLFLVVALMQCC